MKLRYVILVVSGGLMMNVPVDGARGESLQQRSLYKARYHYAADVAGCLADKHPPQSTQPQSRRRGDETRCSWHRDAVAEPVPLRAGYALIVNDYPYLVDAGEGIWRSIARAALVNGDEFTRGLSPEKLKHVFITHLHEDHTVGIPSLLLNPFKLNIPTSKEIYGPNGIRDMVSHIVAAWRIDIAAELSDGYDPEGARATGHEIDFETSGVVYEDANVKVEAFRTIHGPLEDTFAYRFTSDDRVVTFTGDGGPYHRNVVDAAMNADVLVAEVVTEKNIQFAPWGGDTVEEKKREFSVTIFHRRCLLVLLTRRTSA